ncbi:MAG: hypothetical protein ACYTBS_07070 [Planctomycetota bacterium]|jgi:hypothetical protein
MKLDHLVLKKEFVLSVLLAVSAVSAVSILVKMTSFFALSAKAESLVRRAAALNGSDEDEIGQVVAESCAVADDLKKANLFSPPAPKRHPVTSVSGILGDEALIGGRWYKTGDRVQDAQIVAVEATQIRVEWQGREKTFAPLQATGELDSGGSRRISRSRAPAARAGNPTRRLPQMVQVGRSSSAGSGLTADQIEKLGQKVEKQKLAIEKKEIERASRQDAKKSQPNKKKKGPDQAKKAKEKATAKKAKKLSRK